MCAGVVVPGPGDLVDTCRAAPVASGALTVREAGANPVRSRHCEPVRRWTGRKPDLTPSPDPLTGTHESRGGSVMAHPLAVPTSGTAAVLPAPIPLRQWRPGRGVGGLLA